MPQDDRSLEDQLAELAAVSRQAAALMAVRTEVNALVNKELATVLETRKFIPNLSMSDLVAASGVNAGQIHTAGKSVKNRVQASSESTTEAA